MHRCNVDDAAPIARAHAGDDHPAGLEGAAQVDGDHRVPTLGGEVLDARDVLDAGVVDEDILWFARSIC